MSAGSIRLTITLYWSDPIRYSDDNADLIPGQPGVYEILVKLKAGGGKRRYVGESGGLWMRFHEHLQDNERNECVKDYVRNYETYFRYVQPIPKQEDRKDVEKALYDRYKHKCNSLPHGQPPRGSGRQVAVILSEVPRDEIVALS